MIFSAKEGWLRVRFSVLCSKGKVKEVSYTASRCKVLRRLADKLTEALKGLECDRIQERVKEVMATSDLPQNRENRRSLILQAFGI